MNNAMILHEMPLPELLRFVGMRSIGGHCELADAYRDKQSDASEALEAGDEQAARQHAIDALWLRHDRGRPWVREPAPNPAALAAYDAEQARKKQPRNPHPSVIAAMRENGMIWEHERQVFRPLTEDERAAERMEEEPVSRPWPKFQQA